MQALDAIPFSEIFIEDAVTLETSHFFATEAPDGSILSIGCARRGGDIQVIVIPDRYYRPRITTTISPGHRFRPNHYADGGWLYQDTNITYAPIPAGKRAEFIDNIANADSISFRYDNAIYGIMTTTFSYTFSRENFIKTVAPCKSEKIFKTLSGKFEWVIAP